MKVLIFTDNLQMYKSFLAIIEGKNLHELHDFSYSCSIGNGIFATISNVHEQRIRDNVVALIKTYDLIISCHSKQIFPEELVNNVRCINIHPGLNPYNRGWFPQVFSIINKLPVGVTIHEMDAEIDHGNIIIQEELLIQKHDTSLTSYEKILSLETKLLVDHIETIIDNLYVSKAMKFEGNYNSKTDFNELCKLDLEEQCTMSGAIDKLRALSHGDYKNAYFIDGNGDKIYISIEMVKAK